MSSRPPSWKSSRPTSSSCSPKMRAAHRPGSVMVIWYCGARTMRRGRPMELMTLVVAVGAALAVLPGCKKQTGGGKSEPAVTAAQPRDDGFLYGNVEVVPRGTPQSFAAAIAHTPAAVMAGEGPPRVYVRARVCAGDAEMQERLLTAMRAAA